MNFEAYKINKRNEYRINPIVNSATFNKKISSKYSSQNEVNDFNRIFKLKNETNKEIISLWSLDNTIDKLNNKQETLLTVMSYLNIDEDLFKDAQKKGKVTISNLENIILDKDENYLGNLAKIVTGMKITPTDIIKDLKKII